ncbi:inositol 2-dehydrogenase [Aliiruegeria sabulilitoris]|uniref:inositol 2-dehydrogenase n=1 Tax=Aliiruegeria sabulilitoris TaxID=1510458 RepID=UPI000830790A|nr:inositol 2-dehydrogenase [Aliiruegeria sabulilitoris]NDR55168.1 inositol 2-dehydrogenase [Pseudoruegeria sp. M32A2M]
MRIGILGCGRIGRVHAGSVLALSDTRLVAVADAIHESARALADETGSDARTAEEIVSADDIDAVVIATPTTTHYDLIHALASAGKAIFCEKPIDMSAARIRECIDAVNRANIPFMTGFNRRFDPNFARLQRLISEGEIGNVEIVTILSRDPSPPPHDYVRTSGGLFRDMMIHDFDMARFLLGEEPDKIHAVGSALVDPEVARLGDVDTAAVTLTTPSGRICQISNSRRATYGYDQRIEVHGAKGLLRAGNVHENTVELANRAGYQSAPAKEFFLERYEAAYRNELESFISSVRNVTQPVPSIHDGLKAQLIADAATESWKTGRSVRI